MMLTERYVFLDALKCSLKGQGTDSGKSLNQEGWERVLLLAEEQNVTALIHNAICMNTSFRITDRDFQQKWRKKALQSLTRQVIQEHEFLTLMKHAAEQKLRPVVLKGLICRTLYPVPILRPSVDEDLLIEPTETEEYHSFFLSEGLSFDEQGFTREERADAAELSYHKDDSPTYIELHKFLFNPDSKAYGDLNSVFEGYQQRLIEIKVEDVTVNTLAPTDHLLFLILHAFKHFLHSGIGIRTICDIGIFADSYCEEIDWRQVKQKLQIVNAFFYAKALLRILQLYLLPEAGFFKKLSRTDNNSALPDERAAESFRNDSLTDGMSWNLASIDVEPLMEDILASGVHGASSMSRLHSSNLTLYAVENRKKGERPANPLLHSIFLPLKDMKKRYSYLKKIPVLLPAAWMQRIIHYLVENEGGDSDISGKSESLRLGKERIDLLEQYHILEKDK